MEKNGCKYVPKIKINQQNSMKKKVGTCYHPTDKTYRNGSCPEGYILRNAYNKKSYKKNNGTIVHKSHVNAKCIKNTGLPGKTADKFKKIKIDKKSSLEKFGYSTKLVKRLNALRNLTKTSQPKKSKKYDNDIIGLQKWKKNMEIMLKGGSNKSKSNIKKIDKLVKNILQIEKNIINNK